MLRKNSEKKTIFKESGEAIVGIRGYPGTERTWSVVKWEGDEYAFTSSEMTRAKRRGAQLKRR